MTILPKRKIPVNIFPFSTEYYINENRPLLNFSECFMQVLGVTLAFYYQSCRDSFRRQPGFLLKGLTNTFFIIIFNSFIIERFSERTSLFLEENVFELAVCFCCSFGICASKSRGCPFPSPWNSLRATDLYI